MSESPHSSASMDTMNMSKAIKKGRTWLYVLGSLSILLGILGAGMSVTMTIVSILFMAVLLFISGIIQFFDIFVEDGWKNKLLAGFISLIYIITGIMIFQNPAASAVWFTLFIASFLIVAGISRIGFAFSVRDELPGWFLVVISGIISIGLGILIFAQWPVSGLWVIGLFVSVELIMQGFAMIATARMVKKLGPEEAA